MKGGIWSLTGGDVWFTALHKCCQMERTSETKVWKKSWVIYRRLMVNGSHGLEYMMGRRSLYTGMDG